MFFTEDVTTLGLISQSNQWILVGITSEQLQTKIVLEAKEFLSYQNQNLARPDQCTVSETIIKLLANMQGSF